MGEATAERLGAAASYRRCDVTDSGEWAGLVAATVEAEGRVDVLVNNAAVLHQGPIENTSEADFRKLLEVNTLGPLKLTSALLGNLGAGSKVVHITSRMGSVTDNTSGGHYGYRMSKAALNMAMKSMSVDLAPRGISVCVLHPGYVRTGMTGQNGYIDADESATGLIARVDALCMENTGGFWHQNGEELPW